MSSGSRQLEERLDGRRHGDDFRLRRPAAAHRHDNHACVTREQACEMASDRRLADALPGPDDRDRW
jgi:hypothetical protein